MSTVIDDLGVGGTPVASSPSKALAEASPPFPVALGERLRLVDDPLQWIVEHQVSKTPKGKDSGWRPIRFHRDRDALLAWLLHHHAPPEVLATVAAFPRWHP